jgi:hypothetical protein
MGDPAMMSFRQRTLVWLTLFTGLVATTLSCSAATTPPGGVQETAAEDEASPALPDPLYILSPGVHPATFVDTVDNPYFPLEPGTTYTYRAETEEGTEIITVEVLHERKEVMGISATVVLDTVQLDGELKEKTWDWYAQDKEGNVWYLGEDTQEYEGGQVISTAGAWEAGVDGHSPAF